MGPEQFERELEKIAEERRASEQAQWATAARKQLEELAAKVPCDHPNSKMHLFPLKPKGELFWCAACGAVAMSDGSLLPERQALPHPPPGMSAWLRPKRGNHE